jgi:hypothetical protein
VWEHPGVSAESRLVEPGDRYWLKNARAACRLQAVQPPLFSQARCYLPSSPSTMTLTPRHTTSGQRLRRCHEVSLSSEGQGDRFKGDIFPIDRGSGGASYCEPAVQWTIPRRPRVTRPSSGVLLPPFGSNRASRRGCIASPSTQPCSTGARPHDVPT